MANVEKLSVALTQDMAAELRAAVEGGDYGSVSEVVQEALRDWRLRRKIEKLEIEELRRLVQEGIESGSGLDAGEVFAGYEPASVGRQRSEHAAPVDPSIEANLRTAGHQRGRIPGDWL